MVAHVRERAGIEVGRKGGGDLKRLESGGWEVRMVRPRQGWEDRGGCEPCRHLRIKSRVQRKRR